jgi:hypothetical protein
MAVKGVKQGTSFGPCNYMSANSDRPLGFAYAGNRKYADGWERCFGDGGQEEKEDEETSSDGRDRAERGHRSEDVREEEQEEEQEEVERHRPYWLEIGTGKRHYIEAEGDDCTWIP